MIITTIVTVISKEIVEIMLTEQTQIVTLQAVIEDPSSLEAVHEARKRFLESFTEEDSVAVVNDKLVYVGVYELSHW